MSAKTCPVCDKALLPGIRKWHYKCPECFYENGDLPPAINNENSHNLIDEKARETGLRELRLRNFKRLILVLSKLKSDGGSLLEVGCAHGWFLEVAQAKFNVLGIEPDKTILESIASKALPVRNGYFPGSLEESEKFDIIIFNDVFEHISIIQKTLEECHKRLNDGGLLVLNLPSSDGVFYKLSRFFAYFGKFEFFERLWQEGLPSPHVHYFNSRNLVSILKKTNFTSIANGTLPTLSLAGLYTRISYTGKFGALSKVFIYCTIAVALPILRLLPSDIIYVIAKKT
ncbi:class I SAM-dependent methyltransferase [Pseudomonas fluorescens]|uniref:Ubiquinone biosynthesis O-methyltransferase n=1 Tax=Pseudomonas fluorescens TaxID=294 RepID=A0A5E7BTW7_PSEFL|nr:class I SAM-dependent methyltransferase [Pseudomonas fluorescens]VVN93197.1 Ubiquinone biosynthesis O-methyltransferase [Pseudomonas fluorescens]